MEVQEVLIKFKLGLHAFANNKFYNLMTSQNKTYISSGSY